MDRYRDHSANIMLVVRRTKFLLGLGAFCSNCSEDCFKSAKKPSGARFGNKSGDTKTVETRAG